MQNIILSTLFYTITTLCFLELSPIYAQGAPLGEAQGYCGELHTPNSASYKTCVNQQMDYEYYK